METVALTSPEMYAAKAVAFQIQLGKEKTGIHNGRICTRDDLAINLEGQLGEIAVCKYLHIYYCPNIHLSGDGGVDYNYRGVSLQVKSTQTNYLLFQRKERMTCDYAILATSSRDKPNLVFLRGWTDHKTWHEKCVEKEFIEGVKSFGLHADELNPIEELDEVITNAKRKNKTNTNNTASKGSTKKTSN